MSDESSERDKRGGIAEAIRAFSRNRRALRMSAVICLGLVQGTAIYLMAESSPQWHWYITAFLLPLPFYLAGHASKRAAMALIPWGALLMLLGSGQIFFRNPYVNWQGSQALYTAAYIGALLLLPNFVSWIDGDGAFPEWRVSFRHFSRAFFASILAGLFLMLFLSVGSIGVGLSRIIRDIDLLYNIVKWIARCSVAVACAAWGAAFYWAAGAKKLLEVLERYVLALFSCPLPFLSVFTLIFIAALPMGVDRLWGRGFSSGIVLSVFLASGLCAFAGWQGGVNEDGSPREPFFRPVNNLVKAALVMLPVFCPLLVYTIGLRIRQYSWTVDRAVSMGLAVAFGLWSLAWAFFLVRHWKTWPLFYGKVNRVAFPALSVALILFASPLCDVRRIVVRERLEWLRESIQAGQDVKNFDWRYMARDLGIYGFRAVDELRVASDAEFQARLGPFADASQAEKLRDDIADVVASVNRDLESRRRWGDDTGPRKREITSEDFVLNARNAPVFGGELSPLDRERLARGVPKKIVSYRVRVNDARVDYFYLADMDGDGEKEVLLGLGNDIYVLQGDDAFQLRQTSVAYRGRGVHSDNKLAISDDEHEVVRNGWGMLRINDRVYFVEPDDARKIESSRVR
ncbi:MAG: DUF4153 domain-containing protein [Synergistaceae bacterium]|jgi:hypothetical protein|nr:DUF4153 domain-containing protein [Synergistaceae bacterium]